jgi:hypothetical protein
VVRRYPWWLVLVVVLWLVSCGPAGPGGGNGGGGGGGGGDATLMIPTFDRIQVINGSLDAMARRVPLRLSGSFTAFIPCGPMAIGPGGRLYVASLTSLGVTDESSAIAVFEAAAVGGGSHTPVAVLYAPDRFENVCGVAFDQNGTLWTVNNNQGYGGGPGETPTEVIAVRGLTGTESGDIDLSSRSPALASFDAAVSGLFNVVAYDVRVDGSGSLWLLSTGPDALIRYDAIASVTSAGASVAPSFVLTPNVFASLPAFTSSTSMAVDGAGNVYVAASGAQDVVGLVSRFDGAGTRSGREDDAQPDAFLFLDGIDGRAAHVAVDAQGRLWAAGDTKVARFGPAASMPGNVPQSPAYAITYVVDGQGNTNGGMTFVPVPPGLGF